MRLKILDAPLTAVLYLSARGLWQSAKIFDLQMSQYSLAFVEARQLWICSSDGCGFRPQLSIIFNMATPFCLLVPR
jgi:hypothetical protein